MHTFFTWYITTLPRDLFEWIAYPINHTFYMLRG